MKRFIRLRHSLSILLALSTLGFIFSVFYKYKETIFVLGNTSSTRPSIFLRSSLSAEIKDILIKTNDSVVEGQPLITFKCDDLKDDLNLSMNRKNRIVASLKSLESNYVSRKTIGDISISSTKAYITAYTELEKGGAVSKLQLQEYRQQLAKQQIQMNMEDQDYNEKKSDLTTKLLITENELKKAESKVKSCTLKSPINGIISEVNVKRNELLNIGSPILRIFQPGDTTLVFNLTTQQLPHVRLGKTFKVRVNAYPFQRYGDLNATVKSISPITDIQVEDSGSNQLNKKNNTSVSGTYLMKASILNNLKAPPELPEPTLSGGLDVVGLFQSTEKRLIYILSDQFVKIQTSIQAMRSRF